MKHLGRWHNHLFAFALLVFSLWVGRYWYSQEFGLYEDDYTRTLQALMMSLPQLG